MWAAQGRLELILALVHWRGIEPEWGERLEKNKYSECEGPTDTEGTWDYLGTIYTINNGYYESMTRSDTGEIVCCPPHSSTAADEGPMLLWNVKYRGQSLV